MQLEPAAPAAGGVDRRSDIAARIERLPITRPVSRIRAVVGAATFFDGYTVIAISYAMPVLARSWHLHPQQIGLILSMGYLGQTLGALLFGALAERFGRLPIILLTILLFVSFDIACLFAWGAISMMLFRFAQGIGTGGEVPVASTLVNEYTGARGRGRFFLLYEVTFLVGLVAAGLIGRALVPSFGWRAMFVVGIAPALALIPLQFLVRESPRWLAARGRYAEADRIVTELEQSAVADGHALAAPAVRATTDAAIRSDWRELFRGIYRRRTVTIWGMWFCSYLVANGMIAWLPTLYRQVFHLPLQTSLLYGLLTSLGGIAAAILCALLIDRVGRKRWYVGAFLLAPLPLAALALSGAGSALRVLVLAGLAYAIVQTITFSLYLYSAELYPTRLRAIGTGFGSAWLRLGSSAGPMLVGSLMASFGIRSVFDAFALVLVAGAALTALGAIETRGRALEEVSP